MTKEQFTDKDGLMTRLEACYPHMSKGQRLLYRYVLEHYMQVSHMTADALGQAVGISESTVIRFAMTLGYDGYPQFKQAVERYAHAHLNPAQRLQDKFAGCSERQILNDVLRTDANRIRSASEHTDPHAFAGVVDLILSAESIYIVGQAGMEPFARYLAYGLQMVFPHVSLLEHISEPYDLFPALHMKAGDVLLAVGSEGRTEDLIRLFLFAHARGTAIVTLFAAEEIREFADRDLSVSAAASDISETGGTAVCYSLLHALLTAVYVQRPEAVRAGTEAIGQLKPQSGGGQWHES